MLKNAIKAYRHFIAHIDHYLCGLFFLCILMGGWLLYTEKLTETDNIIRYFGFTFAICSIMFAAIQFRAGHDWNRRQFAMTAAYEVKEKMNTHMAVLDEKFKYVHRKKGRPISVEEIHKVICKVDDKGDCVTSQGKLVLSTEENSRKARKAIAHLLNSFEYLASGIKQNVFDEEIIKDLYQSTMIKTYYVFRDYIEHYNKEMYPERNGRIWKSLKEIAVRFEEDLEK